MSKYLIISTTLLLILFLACNTNESNSNDQKASQEKSKIENSDQENIVFAKVDNLEIRAKPIMESSALTKVQKNEQMILTGERTGFIDTISVNGESFSEPWVKVKTKKNRIGWVFGGYIKSPLGD